MEQTKTKKALIMSVLSVFLCIAMLIGMTFAWFTDTASTGVNKIQSGNLDVALEMYDTTQNKWVSAEGKTLQFKVNGQIPAESTQILWEPGCRYELPELRVVNKGNLALKYKVVVTGATGDMELLDVIQFSAVLGTDKTAQVSNGSTIVEGNLNNENDSLNFTIRGTMDQTAGNEYQGKSISGIAITVYATQAASEYDSFGNTYDAGADMTPDNLDHFATVNGVAYDNLTNALENASEGSVITLNKSTTEPIKLENTEPITIENVTFKGRTGVSIKGMQLVATSAANKVTLKNVKFENINFTDKVVLGQNVGTNGYSQCSSISFENCTFDMSASTEKYKDAIYHKDIRVSGDITEEKERNAYLNGLTVKNCKFVNARYAISGGKVRNITVSDCNFTNLSDVAISLGDLAGKVEINGNTANDTKGILGINTVGNNYSTTNIETEVIIKNNKAINMTCDNGYVFYTGYDNAKASGKSTYTITGNMCTYTKSFENPLNGFRIKNTYGPSKAEFIENN